MKLTKMEVNGAISFLDVLVKRINSTFETFCYRKKTFTVLGTSVSAIFPRWLRKLSSSQLFFVPLASVPLASYLT